MAQAISNVAPKKSPFAITGSGTLPKSNGFNQLTVNSGSLMAPPKPTPAAMQMAKGLSIGSNGQVVTPQPKSPSTTGLVSPAPTGTFTGQTSLLASPMAAVAGTEDRKEVQPSEDAKIRGLFADVAASLGNPKATKETRDAIKFYENSIKTLGEFEKRSKETREGIYESPTSARVMSARDMAIQQVQAEERARLQGVIQEAQTGVGFGQTQQSLNQSAQQGIAGLIQPSPAAFGQTVFNPATGTFDGGGGNLDPQVVASDLAQKVISNQMTYDQAVSSLGYAGGAGQQFLNNAIKGLNPAFNIPQATATAAGQAGVIGTLPALESADTAAEGIKGKITTYLASNPQLNPSTLAAGNTLQQWIQGKQLSDPKYQTLFNYLNEYTNTLAPILGVGGDTTNLKTQIAQSFINAAASGQSIAEVLENIQGLSKGKIQDIRSGATGGGVVSSPQTGGGTGSGGLYDW